MVEGFRRCAEHLEKFGGHEYAGGLSIKEEKLGAFAEAFERVARECLAPENLLPCLEVDARLNFAEMGSALIRELESLKPFGVGNPEPLFMTEQVEICERRPFNGGVRFRFRQGGRVIGGVAFGAGDDFLAAPDVKADLVYRLSENEWNGTTAIELKIVDARPTMPC
jgi:single-stranded-DNA-specific exonuclease